MKKSLIKIFNHQYFSWVIILLLFILQFLMTQNSLNQIRFEELSESVRNVYFLDQRQIFDGISSNVGWYGTVLTVYKIFGFNLFLIKFYKLVIFALGLISIEQILKYFKVSYRFVILLLIGLSPTFLFFNVIMTAFGIDVFYFLIIFYLILVWSKWKNKLPKLIGIFAIWFLVMVASMSYGVFLAYLPIFGIFFLYLLFTKKSKWQMKIWQVISAMAGFFLPLVWVLNYMLDPAKLLFDPSNNSGLFRGGGVGEKITSLSILTEHLKLSLSTLYQDLFISGQSYYYEPVRTELSHQVFPIVILVLFLISVYILIKYKKSRVLILSGYLLIIIGILVGGFSDWFPGIRRMTPVMMGALIVFSGMWKVTPSLINKSIFDKAVWLTVLMCFFLTIIHHLKVYPDNLRGLVHDSKHKAGDCFHLENKNPNQSIQSYLNRAMSGEVIQIKDDCRLHELYPAIVGACEWNDLNCHEIKFDRDEEFKKPI